MSMDLINEILIYCLQAGNASDLYSGSKRFESLIINWLHSGFPVFTQCIPTIICIKPEFGPRQFPIAFYPVRHPPSLSRSFEAIASVNDSVVK
jgi:hypothetical protein